MEPAVKLRKREIITVKVQKMPKNKTYRERFNSDDNMMLDEENKFLSTRQKTTMVRRESTGSHSRRPLNLFDKKNKKEYDFDRFNSQRSKSQGNGSSEEASIVLAKSKGSHSDVDQKQRQISHMEENGSSQNQDDLRWEKIEFGEYSEIDSEKIR